jgi:acyl-CoA reductase-like NAD-dependent aldehyde dehydrogenase
MTNPQNIYVDGTWIRSASEEAIAVMNPATGQAIGSAPAGSAQDVERAVAAARRAFAGWSATPVADRIAAVDRIRQGMLRRAEELALLVTRQMGSPLAFSRLAQVGMPVKNLDLAARAMETLVLEEAVGSTLVVKEPIGVVCAITPWNFPLHQITAKIAPALASGCTVVLKPSELTPLDACVLAEIVHEAGLPAGVFNLVLGTGRNVGEAMVAHPDVDMVSFTGSTLAGQRIAETASRTLKKLALELGGKSANIMLDDVDLDQAIATVVKQGYANAGQACACLSRVLVPRSMLREVEQRIVAEARNWTVGDPLDEHTRMGPVASLAQRQRVRDFIESGQQQGARLLLGGPQPPEHLAQGAYIRPTVFTDVHASMRIAREEIFGPVLSLMAYDDVGEAVHIANDSPYGLSGGVWSSDPARALTTARRLRTGQVVINGAPLNLAAPFGGYKMSGLGREYGRYGLEEFFEVKSLQGAI